MKNSSLNKSLFYVLPIISILAVIAMGVVGIQPKIVSIMEKQAQLQTEEDNQRKLETKIQTLDVLNKNKIEMKAKLTSVDLALPTQKDIPNLIIQLQRIAQESDTEIQGIQAAPGKLINDSAPASKVGPEISLNVAIRGNYEAIKTFLGKVYRAKRLINMESISLTAGGSDGDGSLTVTLVMNTYFQPLANLRPTDESEEIPNLDPADDKTYERLQSYTAYALDDSAPAPLVVSTPQASPSAAPSSPPETSPSATPR